eukprot:scaffold15697_cov40-Cyclotella_meneghiniana.AAC.4
MSDESVIHGESRGGLGGDRDNYVEYGVGLASRARCCWIGMMRHGNRTCHSITLYDSTDRTIVR